MTTVGLSSRESIRDAQSLALGRLLCAVAASNPFYGPILREAGIDGAAKDLEAFQRRMPFTRKTAIVDDQLSHPPYGTNLTYPLSDYTRFTQTSGTRGAPLRWLDTPESWQWMLDNWRQIYAIAGVGPGDCLYFAFSFGPFLGFWTAFEAAAQMGCRCLPGGGLSSLARLEAMRDNRANVLLCTPTYARRLGEVAAAEKVDLASLHIRTIIVAGEPGGSIPSMRGLIERAWPGATVFDHHGMTEVGPVTAQCPERPGVLLVLESGYLAEIIEPHGDTPVARGEVGELVLTTLGRTGSPLLRYRTGDLVQEDREIAERFGHYELALRGGILGRVDDMLFVRGVNVFPAAVDDLLYSLAEVGQYQMEIDNRGAMSELHLRVEPAPNSGDPHDLSSRIDARLRAAFNLRVTVSVVESGTLPRSEMKSRRWVKVE